MKRSLSPIDILIGTGQRSVTSVSIPKKVVENNHRQVITARFFITDSHHKANSALTIYKKY